MCNQYLFDDHTSPVSSVDPCTNAKVLDNDWRLPSEDDITKCDDKLETFTWYKFKHQGFPALIAQNPIPVFSFLNLIIYETFNFTNPLNTLASKL